MSNLEKYNDAFITTFGTEESELENLQFESIPEWDSVGHMQLIAALEDAFDIMFDTEDIIELNSYEKGKEFMAKYEVAL